MANLHKKSIGFVFWQKWATFFFFVFEYSIRNFKKLIKILLFFLFFRSFILRSRYVFLLFFLSSPSRFYASHNVQDATTIDLAGALPLDTMPAPAVPAHLYIWWAQCCESECGHWRARLRRAALRRRPWRQQSKKLYKVGKKKILLKRLLYIVPITRKVKNWRKMKKKMKLHVEDKVALLQKNFALF